MGEIATIEQPIRNNIAAGARPLPIVPNDFESCLRIARAVHAAGMAPQSLDTAEKCMVAIMHGLEVGMTPMSALQSIAVINGRPSIWGDGALALVYSSGLLEDFREFEEERDGSPTAVCIVKRKGKSPVEGTFSLKQAQTAQLTGKDIWKKYPERMRKMRARAYALRDGFSDVLRGLHIAEEAQDIDERAARAAPTPPAPPAPPPPAIAQQATPPAPPVPQTEAVREIVAASPQRPAEQIVDAEIVPPPPPPPLAMQGAQEEPATGLIDAADLPGSMARVEALCAACDDVDELQDRWNAAVEPLLEELMPPDREDFLAIYERHERRFEP